jgi:hypothetical protein
MVALRSAPADMDRLLHCLHGIARHAPDLVRPFVPMVRPVGANGKPPCPTPHFAQSWTERKPSHARTLTHTDMLPLSVYLFTMQVVFHLPQYQGDYRVLSLKILLAVAADVPDLYTDLQGAGLGGFLRHRYGPLRVPRLCLYLCIDVYVYVPVGASVWRHCLSVCLVA